MTATGTSEDLWELTTAPGTSRYTMHRDPDADPGTVEAWGRAADNPVGGWYGLRNGYRGRFGIPAAARQALGLAELTHAARNNSVRAL